MYKFIIVFFLSLTILFGADTKSVYKSNDNQIIEPGKIVVKYKKIDNYGTVNKSAKIQVSSKFGLQQERAVFERARNIEIKQRLNLDNVFVYAVPVVTDINKLVAELNSDPSIEYAEPVYLSPINTIPNDPLYSSQQHLPQVFAPEAWDDQYGNSSVIIGIIDSGVDWDHEDLADVIWSNTNEVLDGTDTDGNGYIDDIRGWDFVHGVSGSGDTNSSPDEDGENPDNDPMDYDGHGTHVAGIAAASTNNNIGIASVASGALIMPLRCGWHANDGRGYVSSLFASQAYHYAADNGAHITNQSSGSSGQLIVDGAFYAFLNGVLIIESAGNSNNQSPSALGAQPWIISVASLNSNDTKSSFSNFGDYIAVSAPGSSILSTIVEPSPFYGGNKYVRLSGTSMAAPVVASVAGLVKAKYPHFDVIELFTQVVETADNIDAENPNYVDLLGSGRVNAARALSESVTAKPRLQINGLTIDETSGNSNGVLEPGETADLIIEVKNMWAPGSNINATLSVLDEWPVTIENNSASIPSIGSILDTANSTASISFSISCSEDAYPTTVQMELQLSGSDLNQTLNFALGISPQILFVADFAEADDGEFDFSSFYFDDFNSQKIAYDYVHRALTEVTYEMLSKYEVVVWSCEWAFPSLTAGDRAAIAQYLDNGGALFISGQDIGWDLNENSENLDVAFFNNYLKAHYLSDDAGKSVIFGVDNDPISDGITADFYQIRRASTQQYPDEITTFGGSVPILKYSDGTAGAIRYRGNYDLVFFAFGGYESILDDDIRQLVLRRIMNWFAGINYSLQVITDTEDTQSDIEININVETESSLASVKLFYSTNNSFPYDVIDMTDLGSGNFQASIPAQSDGTDVSYFVYIKPTDGIGILTETINFYVGEDLIPPTVELLSNPVRNSINLFGIDPFELQVMFTDNFGIDESTAMLHYWVNDNAPNSILLTQYEEDIFSGTFSFDSRLHFGDQVSYYFSVNDLSSNSNLSRSDTTVYSIDSTQVVDDFELPILDWDVTGSWGLTSAVKKNGNYSLTDSPIGPYANNSNSTATYKMPFDLSSYTAGEISYWIRAQLEVGVDSLLFELSYDNGTTWKIIDAVSQNFIFFSQRFVNISEYTGDGYDNVVLRFRLYANATNNADGVYIDDIIINVTPDPALSVSDSEIIPLSYELSQNYPNPFNPSTTINFAVPVRSDVKITIFNILGEVVEILHNSNIDAGTYSLSFNAANKLSSGIYFYQIIANGIDGKNFNQTKKMMLIK